MRAVFFSDAHLRTAESEGARLLLQFLGDISGTLDHLFVVGDLFDFWFSRNGIVYPGFRPVIAALETLHRSGAQIHLFEGNHDFHLADYFARHPGFEVVPDTSVTRLQGKTLLVGHGDLVDETDRGYRLLRRILRSRAFHGIQKRLPLPLLWKVARMSADTSKTYLAKPQERLAAKLEEYARAKFEEGIDAVILGHCHVPSMKTYTMENRPRQFILLGDWLSHHSYAVLESGRFELCHYGR